MMDYATLVREIEKLVNDGATGTMFVTTNEQHSMRIGIRAGQIVSVVYRTVRGLNAIPLVRSVRSGTPRFEPNFVIESQQGPETLPSTADLLRTLRG